MSKLFVTRELALRLEELGFDEQCVAISTESNEEYFSNEIVHFSSKDKVKYIFGKEAVLLPTWDQAINWIHLKLDYFYDLLELTCFSDYSGEWILNPSEINPTKIETIYFENQEEMLKVAIELWKEQLI